MKGKFIYHVCICLCALMLVFTSCKHKDKPTPIIDKTIFVYMPWSNNLTNFFYQNISDLKEAIINDLTDNQRVVVFFSTTAIDASLYELKKEGKECKEVLLKEYVSPPFTTASGITSILNDVKSFAPALNYAMIIGSHGMGWLPVDGSTSRGYSMTKRHWEYEGVPMTRFFGGTEAKYQTDITTLATGIINAGIKMEYILFDDCYMANIEVAYDLKEATHYLMASTSEIMAYGMPYSVIGGSLFGNTNYKAVCDGFYSFYSTYEVMPCGTFSVIDCSQLYELAQIMREINHKYTFDESLLNTIQRLDGYYPVLFYDYGDYVRKLCTDDALYDEFQQQLNKAVPHHVHTPYYYSMNRGKIAINTFSGITTSEPSTHPEASEVVNTSWYKATH